MSARDAPRRAGSRAIVFIAAALLLAPCEGGGRGRSAELAPLAMALARAADATPGGAIMPSPRATGGADQTSEHALAHHLAAVRPLLERYGYAAVFAAIFVEGFGIPAPGQTLLIAAALLAAGGGLALVPLLLVALVASAGGTLVGWWVGRVGGRRILDRFAGPRLDRLQDLCGRRGGLLVAFGRFVDGARQLAGIVAGALGMALPGFLAWNALGALAWVAAWGLGTYVLERNVHGLVDAYHRVGPVAAAAVLALFAAVIFWLLRGRRAG